MDNPLNDYEHLKPATSLCEKSVRPVSTTSPCASCARVHDISQRHVALAKLVSPPPAVSLAVPAANGPGQRPRGPFVPAGCLAVATRLFETVPLV